MVAISAWVLLVLGFAHMVYGWVRFRQPLVEAFRAGFVGQFGGFDARRLAFWFMIAGPLVVMSGQVALHAVQTADLGLLRIVGVYMLVVATLGMLALPRSPFWIALLLSPVLLAGGYGWLAL